MRKQLPPRDHVLIDERGRPTEIFYEYLQNLEGRSAGTPVSVTAPTDGQVLVYNSTTGLYEPKSVGFGTVRNVVSFSPGVALTSGNSTVVNSIALPAGTGPWLTSCQSGMFGNSGSPQLVHMHADFGDGTTTIQSSPGDGTTTAFHIDANHPNGWIFSHMAHVFPYSASARTINNVILADWTGGGTVVGYGTLEAVRATFT